MAFSINGVRPWFAAKLNNNAITSVAAWTGTKSKVTKVTSTATTAEIGAALGQLIDDLRASNIIK